MRLRLSGRIDHLSRQFHPGRGIVFVRLQSRSRDLPARHDLRRGVVFVRLLTDVRRQFRAR